MTHGSAGFVGLGLMGAPMADNLIKGGWSVSGWNRSPAAVRDLELLGGTGVESVADLRDEPIIIFMLPDLPHIEDAAAGLLERETSRGSCPSWKPWARQSGEWESWEPAPLPRPATSWS